VTDVLALGESMFVKEHFRSMNVEAATETVAWRYDPPFNLYNLSPEDIPLLIDPVNRYFAVYDETGRIVGICCYGVEARVAGGDYGDGVQATLDVGVGMSPDLVGRGQGAAFVRAVLAFAQESFAPHRFRVTIAAFNERSRRTFRRLGFEETFRFTRDSDGLDFIQMEREAEHPGGST
jgi:RimJ/RimL family protein N-acetyltransferase